MKMGHGTSMHHAACRWIPATAVVRGWDIESSAGIEPSRGRDLSVHGRWQLGMGVMDVH
jgi:hypothetical protein